MATSIAAANISAQAFRMMELAPISSFADDSPQASDATEQYPIALGMCLEDYDWSFARRLVNLPPATLPSGIAVDVELPNTYALPGDFLILRHVVPECTLWRIDETLLRSDQTGSITIRYTRKIDDETRLPKVFQTAVSAQLAVLLMPRWVKSRTKKADLISEAGTLLQRARDNDRQSASAARYDGRNRQGDWVAGATS